MTSLTFCVGGPVGGAGGAGVAGPGIMARIRCKFWAKKPCLVVALSDLARQTARCQAQTLGGASTNKRERESSDFQRSAVHREARATKLGYPGDLQRPPAPASAKHIQDYSHLVTSNGLTQQFVFAPLVIRLSDT
jgi:hypothetical protein